MRTGFIIKVNLIPNRLSIIFPVKLKIAVHSSASFSTFIVDTRTIILKNGTNAHDKPYYLWVAWRNRKYIKKELKTVKHKIAYSLEDFLIGI